MSWITPHSTTPHVLKISRGVFVMVIESSNRAWGRTWSNSDAASIADLLKLIPKGSKLSAKIVGDPQLASQLSSTLSAQGIKIEKLVERTGDFEVWFSPSEARLRVTQSETPTQKQGKIKVLIVDDSPTIRQLLTRILSTDPTLEVMGAADRPSQAIAMIQKSRPDVITLDIHMPEMDGVTFLKSYLPKHPIPTVMISSISMEEGPMVLNALEAGAVDYIQKPSLAQLPVVAPLILEKIRTAASAKVAVSAPNLLSRTPITHASNARLDLSSLVAIGSSTGGTEALKVVLTGLPENIPPIVIVQHIPPVFSKAFADRMNELCPFEVLEAKDGDEVIPGRVLIAPGGKQMSLKRRGNQASVVINDDAPVNRFKPSVDYLFESIVREKFTHTLGIILTGMGADGAKGLLALKTNGARTIAQDEKSCVVFGMPREAIRLGAAEKVCPLEDISSTMLLWLSSKKAA